MPEIARNEGPGAPSSPVGIHSLRYKVPLYIGTGLLVVLAVWTWVAYGTVRTTSLDAGRDHLQSVTKEFANTYQNSVRDVGRNMYTAVNIPVIRNYLRNPSPRPSDSLLSALRRFNSTQIMRVELFSPSGSPLLAVMDSQVVDARERHEELALEFTRSVRGPDFAAIAPLRILRDTVVIPIVSAVLVDSQPVGFIAIWRRIAASPQTRELITQLIGAQARPYIGNTRGDLWADFAGAPHKFPRALPLDGTVVEYKTEDNEPVMASARSIPGSPWAFGVEFGTGAVVAPAHAALDKFLKFGIAVLILSTLAAWLLSRRLTQPVHNLTVAARAFAKEDYTTRVANDRADEIGVLSRTFNVMADRVANTHEELERKVADRTKQLQDRTEEIEAFAHSISHDLRAPLRAMTGFSQALIEDSGDKLDETGKDYARRIARAAQRMDQLTQDLLAFSKVSRADVTLAPVDLDVVVRDALGHVESDVAARHATVRFHEPFPSVMANRATLEQTIANLFSNAVKFVPEGTPPRVEVRSERRNGNVRLWVEDNGIGIAPGHQQRIFNVFERLHSTEEYAGTGIGLAIVRKAIERMGGRVGVESSPGAGSRFWIELQSAEVRA